MEIFVAYLNRTEQFNPITHARHDERAVAIRVSQSEGEFPTASLTVAARADGWLRLGRRVAISCRKDGIIFPLIVGTITAAPIGLSGEFVDLEIIGRAHDWQARQDALIASAAVAPYFDPLFGDAKEADDVLTGRGATIAWDRISGLPRLSDIIEGPRTFQFDRVDDGSAQPEVEAPPFERVDLKISAKWTQDASVRSIVEWPSSTMEIVADKALADALPRPEEDIGGGWRVLTSDLRLSGRRLVSLGEIPAKYDSAIYSGKIPVFTVASSRVELINDRAQAREESITVRLAADVQPVSEPGDERIEVELDDIIGTGDGADPWSPTASYSTGDVVFYAGALYSATVDHTGGWTFNPSQWTKMPAFQGRIDGTFFGTARGAAAIRHAVERAKARLRYAGRAIRVSFDVPLEDALELQIDDRATLTHRSMPGGTMTGKIVSYDFSIDESSRDASITIACAVGRGGTSAPVIPALTDAPSLRGPDNYPSTGKITPTAAAQIEQLRQAPDVSDISIRVEIDAPAVPVAHTLQHSQILNCGTISLERGVNLE